MQLSRSFELSELLRSPEAARHGIDMRPPQAVLERLTWLCVHVLQPLRDLLGKAIFVSSGYRPEELNRLVGGANDSAHLYGRAADIEVFGMPNLMLARFVSEQNLLQLDKCILEFPTDEDPQAGWVHVQVPEKGGIARAQYLTALRSEGRTVYREGLLTRVA
jgi:hypothetical protein